MSAAEPFEAPDGTRWVYFKPDNEWTGWQPGEDGVWIISDAEFRRRYPNGGNELGDDR